MQIVKTEIVLGSAWVIDSAIAVNLLESEPSIPLTLQYTASVGSQDSGTREIYCILPEEMTDRPGTLWSVEFQNGGTTEQTKVVLIEDPDGVNSNPIVYAYKVGESLDPNHTHNIFMRMSDYLTLIETGTIDLESNEVDYHTHVVTFVYDSDSYLISVVNISSNTDMLHSCVLVRAEDNHVTRAYASNADKYAAEGLIYIKRLLTLTEGRTEEGSLGDTINPSVAVFNESGTKVQDITVIDENRTPSMHQVIDRTGDVPALKSVTEIGSDGLGDPVEVVSIADAPVIEEEED